MSTELERAIAALEESSSILKKQAKKIDALLNGIKQKDLFSRDVLSEAKKELKEKPKSKFFNVIATSFMEYFKWNKKIEYHFTGKDGAAVKDINNKLIKIFSNKNIGDVGNEYVSNIITQCLDYIKDNDKFLWDNLSFALFNQKLINIMAKMVDYSANNFSQELRDELKSLNEI